MIIVQKAVIRKDDEFLVVLRSPDDSSFPDHWDFPGGNKRLKEAPKDGIKREVFEKTALIIIPGKVVGSYSLDVNGLPHQFDVFSVKYFSGDIELSHEHTDFKWLTKDEILKLKIEPVIRMYFEENP